MAFKLFSAIVLALAATACARELSEKPMQPEEPQAHFPEAQAMEILTKFGGGLKCKVCEMAVAKIEDFLLDQKMLDKLEAFIENDVCPSIPHIPADKCKMVAEQLISLLPDFIQSHFTPTEACTAVGLCDNSTKYGHVVLRANADDPCTFCKQAMSAFDAKFVTGKTKEEIVAEMNQVCDLVAQTVPDLGEKCKTYVSTYGEKIAFMLLTFTPEQVCQLIHACPTNASPLLGSSVMSLPPSVTSEVVEAVEHYSTLMSVAQNADRCGECKFLVGQVKALLSQEQVQDKILKALLNVCAMLAGDASSKCTAVVTQKGPAILSKIADLLDPETDCAKVGLCSAEHYIALNPVVNPLTKQVA